MPNSPVSCSGTSTTASVSTLTPLTTNNSTTMPYSSTGTAVSFQSASAASSSFTHGQRTSASVKPRSPTMAPSADATSRAQGSNAASRPRLSPNPRPASAVSCPAPPALPAFDCPPLGTAAKTPTPPPRRSRDTSPHAHGAARATGLNGSTKAHEHAEPPATLSLPPLQPTASPPAPSRFGSCSPARGPGPRVEPSDAQPEDTHTSGSVPIPVKDAKRRHGHLTIATGATSPSSTVSGHTTTTVVVPSSFGDADTYLSERGQTSVCSFSTNGTFTMAPRDSSMFSCGSFDNAADAKGAPPASRPLDGSVSPGSDGATRNERVSVSVPQPPAAPNSASSSPPASESRLSRCKRLMQSMTEPAFDIKRVEEASQQSNLTYTSRTSDSATDSLSRSVRQQKLGGDGGMRIALPCAESCYLDEGICNAAECHPITKVNDFIYLGTWRDANSLETLQKHGITHVLNCAKEVDHDEGNGGNAALRFNFDLSHYDESLLNAPDSSTEAPRKDDSQDGNPYVSATIPMSDSHKEKLERNIDAAFFFISLARKRHAKVLVHCRRGISRSPAIVIAFLMATQRTTFQETYDAVLAKRSCVSLNLGFHEFLDETFAPDPKWARLNEELDKRDGIQKKPSKAPAGVRLALSFGAAPPPPQQLRTEATDEEQGVYDDEPFSPFRKPATHSFGGGGFGGDDEDEDEDKDESQTAPGEKPQEATSEAADKARPTLPAVRGTAQMVQVRSSGGTSNNTSASFALMNQFECTSDLEDVSDGGANGFGAPMNRRSPSSDEERVSGPLPPTSHPGSASRQTVKGHGSFPSDGGFGDDEGEAITPPSDRTSAFGTFPGSSHARHGLSGHPQSKFLVGSYPNSSTGSSTAGGCTAVSMSVSHSSGRGAEGASAPSGARRPPPPLPHNFSAASDVNVQTSSAEAQDRRHA